MASITLNEAAYDVFEFYSQNVKDTDNVDIRQIKFWVNTMRAKLLKQKFDKYSMLPIDEAYIQTLAPGGNPVALQMIDSSIYTTLPSNNYFAETTISIPKTIERNAYNHTFVRIGPADKLRINYTIVPYDQALFSGNGKFNHDTVFAVVYGDKILLMSKNFQSISGIQGLNIRGVFSNPVEVSTLNSSTYTDDDEYPINLNLISDMKEMILSREFRLDYKPPIDPSPANPQTLAKEN